MFLPLNRKILMWVFRPFKQKSDIPRVYPWVYPVKRWTLFETSGVMLMYHVSLTYAIILNALKGCISFRLGQIKATMLVFTEWCLISFIIQFSISLVQNLAFAMRTKEHIRKKKIVYLSKILPFMRYMGRINMFVQKWHCVHRLGMQSNYCL